MTATSPHLTWLCQAGSVWAGRTKPPGQAFRQFAGRGQQLVVGAPCSCLTEKHGEVQTFLAEEWTWNTAA